MTNYSDYISKKLGKVMVIDFIRYYQNKNKNDLDDNFLCICDCGRFFTTPCKRFINLYQRNTTTLSCGSCSTKKDSLPTKNPNKYSFDKKYAYIHLDDRNDVAVIDIDDYERVKNHRWSRCGGYFLTGFISNWKYKTVSLHRFIIGEENIPEGMQVDHINRNKLDNRKCNLRVVTRQQNALNTDAKFLYGVAGISKINEKWIATIYVMGNAIKLGSFDTLEEAKKTRLDAELKYYGINRTYTFTEQGD